MSTDYSTQPPRQTAARRDHRGSRSRLRAVRRPRPELITEAVVAGYIHDISVRHSPAASERIRFRARQAAPC